MTLPLHSIRWRLQLWHGLILLAVIAALCLTVYRLSRTNALQRIDQDILQRERTLIMALGRPLAPTDVTAESAPHPPTPPEIIALLRHDHLRLPEMVTAMFQGDAPGHAYFSLRDGNGRVLLQSANVPPALPLLSATDKDMVEELRSVGHQRELCRTSRHGLQSVVGRDITPELRQEHRFAWSLALAGLGLWLTGLLGGWWLAGRAMRPIESISRTAQRIAAGNLQERIDSRGHSELDQLSRVLNETFDRLQAAFARQRQFTADAAHELRTPITILLNETQRALRRERSPEEYRDALGICQQTSQRMRHLIEALLHLARLDDAAAGTAPGPCDLAAILEESIRQLSPQAAAKHIRCATALTPAPCLGDAALLAMVAQNLITNAIHYQPAGGTIRITCGTEETHVICSVADEGPGIPAEDLPHIFERFYRADKARGTDGPLHVGLGLAIAKSIIEAHQGMIQCHTTPGHGAEFTVTLPAAPPAGTTAFP
ncbi:MAG: hypothetical protein BWK76_17535 [Desulfobulbaceae bacterium A2]|nr:MAG: hypothetical protein BWK76_17535 [Desulfobulbaceae bacterium A2]